MDMVNGEIWRQGRAWRPECHPLRHSRQNPPFYNWEKNARPQFKLCRQGWIRSAQYHTKPGSRRIFLAPQLARAVGRLAPASRQQLRFSNTGEIGRNWCDAAIPFTSLEPRVGVKGHRNVSIRYWRGQLAEVTNSMRRAHGVR